MFEPNPKHPLSKKYQQRKTNLYLYIYKKFLPIGQVVVIDFHIHIIIILFISIQALPLKVTLAQVIRLEVTQFVVDALDELDVVDLAEAAGDAEGFGVGGGAARGGRRVARLQPGAGLALSPGQRGRAVGQAGDAPRIGLVAVVAHAAL